MAPVRLGLGYMYSICLLFVFVKYAFPFLWWYYEVNSATA